MVVWLRFGVDGLDVVCRTLLGVPLVFPQLHAAFRAWLGWDEYASFRSGRFHLGKMRGRGFYGFRDVPDADVIITIRAGYFSGAFQ
jgi:hypothetical protein